MVELLVVLVIVALMGGVVIPNIGQWITSQAISEQRKSLAAEISSLPARAHFEQKEIVIDDSSMLMSETDGIITVTKPIRVLSNGYCLGGEITLTYDDLKYSLKASPPLCSVSF